MADSLLADITPVASVTGGMELYVNVPGTPDEDGKATVDQVGDYLDTLYVALSGNQTIADVKTFSSFPVTPSSAPGTDYQASNKKYVDDNARLPAILVTEATTSRTLGLADASKYIRLTNGTSCTITLPNQATVTWLADTEIYFRVAAAGIPTFTLGGSVVLNDPKGVVAALVQGDTFAIKRVASDTWDLI